MPVQPKKLLAEMLGTALLVFFAVGVATASFGFGLAGSSKAAGVVTTAFAFGLMLLVLAYALGPISGCHINPAVTLAFLLVRRLDLREAVGYWVAQVAGGILGALVLWGVLSGADGYSRKVTGLGANGFGKQSLVGLNATGAVVAEVILTGLFVFIVLSATRNTAAPQVAGVVIGLALVAVHLVGIPLTGTSANPARSIGPALIVGGPALSQLWVFIVAPLVGGALAAATHRVLYSDEFAYADQDEPQARVDVAEPVTAEPVGTVTLPDAGPTPPTSPAASPAQRRPGARSD
jgi:aquaporin Z